MALGVNETNNQGLKDILSRKDVIKFCSSCETRQKLDNMNQMIPIPVMGKPFVKVSVDYEG